MVNIRKLPKSISIDERLLQEIDNRRCLASRSAYICFLLKKSLEVQDGKSPE